ncbi:3-phosphoserine/phosphohydroxythreonine transaminase [Shouchella sp. JSM 1781072]|uniref:3-phosphoserine/phosphohydroxythreonine transaminase n=1 Tax=Bacillaceae TaxID=186817 RepID=UPI000C0721A2|nr:MULTISPECIES: 3-phosphoserine/phosphohydroxythreonine transaminase [Bacillaceae]UTR07816.1 3-phosphoserine/phosphohydroxythreonine transaminase [Alkalihalobacillus sp. LMS6]
MKKIHNFSAGPAALPQEVLKKAQADLLNFDGSNVSIMEMSHRSKAYEKVHFSAVSRLKSLMNLGEDTHVLFFQGGANLQFSMIPMNFLNNQSSYVLTGVWSEKAAKEAQRFGTIDIQSQAKETSYSTIPSPDELSYNEENSYLHITSNNTIYGTQWKTFPYQKLPLVCDMSSDILSRSIDYRAFDLIYAGAQKNLGPAGVTIAIVKDSFLKRAHGDLSPMLSYQTFADSQSMYNTPPVFSIYMLNLVLEWIENEGGLSVIEARNQAKASILYDAIDHSDEFYSGHAQPEARSNMNVTFNLANSELEKIFLQEAEQAGFIGLAGHRLVGGIRASTYNAVPLESCNALAAFMDSFRKQHM